MRTNLFKKLPEIMQIILFVSALPFLLSGQEKCLVSGYAYKHNLSTRKFLIYNSGNQVVTNFILLKNALFKFTMQIIDIIFAKVNLKNVEFKNQMYKLQGNFLSYLKGWKNKGSIQYGVMVIPQNSLINPTVKITVRNILSNKPEKKLQEIFYKI